MKRRIIVALICIGLVGCGSNQPQELSPEQKNESIQKTSGLTKSQFVEVKSEIDDETETELLYRAQIPNEKCNFDVYYEDVNITTVSLSKDEESEELPFTPNCLEIYKKAVSDQNILGFDQELLKQFNERMDNYIKAVKNESEEEFTDTYEAEFSHNDYAYSLDFDETSVSLTNDN